MRMVGDFNDTPIELNTFDSVDHQEQLQLTLWQRVYPIIWPIVGLYLVFSDYLTDSFVVVEHCINLKYDYAISTSIVILLSGTIAVIGYQLSTKRKYKDCEHLFGKWSLRCMNIPTFGAVICSFKYIKAKWKEPFADSTVERSIVGGYSSSTLDMSSLTKWFKMVETVFEATPQSLLLIHTIILNFSQVGILKFISITISFLGLTLNVNNYWGATLPFIYEPYTFPSHKFIGIKLLLFTEALAFILSRFLALNLAVFALESHIHVNLLNAVLILIGIIALPRIVFYVSLCEFPMLKLNLKNRIISNLSQLKNSRRSIFLGKFFYSLVAYPAIDAHDISILIIPLYYYIENFLAFLFYYNFTLPDFIPKDVPTWILNLFPFTFPLSFFCFFVRNYLQRCKLKSHKNPKSYLTCCEKLNALMDSNKFREVKEEIDVLIFLHFNFFKKNEIDNTLSQEGTILEGLKFFIERGKYFDFSKSQDKISKDGTEVCYGHLSLVNISSYTLLRLFYYNKGNLTPFNNVMRLSKDQAEILSKLYPLIAARIKHKVKDSEWMSLPTFDFRIDQKLRWSSEDIIFPPNIIIT